jgi:hypothetical protein
MAITSPRASRGFYDRVPLDWDDSAEHRRMLALAVLGLRNGKVDSRDSITLTISVASTTLTDPNIGPQSFIGFMPTTANAAAEIGNGTMYVSSRTQGSATITHANNAQADRTFAYVVLG